MARTIVQKLPLAFAAFILAACQSPSGGSSHPSGVTFGPISDLSGTWTRTETREDGGSVSYGYTETWIVDTANGLWERKQTDDYADDASDLTDWTKGTLTYKAATGAVTFTTTDQIIYSEIHEAEPATADWTTHTTNDLEFRNVVKSGTWYQDIWIRVGTGSGLAGTWESLTNTSHAPVEKYRYTFDTKTSTLTADTYDVDSSNAITGSPTATSSATYSWDGTTITVQSQSMTCVQVDSSDLEIPTSGTLRKFTKPST